MQNQFISAPLLVSKQKNNNYDAIIQNLQQKNQKLKSQLHRIQKALQYHEQPDQSPKQRQSIFQGEQNAQLLQKQLKNMYARIKMYQLQIRKLQEGKGNNLTSKMKQLDASLQQKRKMTQKLKLKLGEQQKIIQQNQKKLQKSDLKEQMDMQIKKLVQQSKFFKQKLKSLEDKQSSRTSNLKKQLEAIKKLQRQLLQQGLAAGQLQEIKHFSLKGKEVPEKDNEQIQVIEDRTKQSFQLLIGQIALLDKLSGEFHIKLAGIQKQMINAAQKNYKTRNKLLQCQNEIQKLQDQLVHLKSHIIPINLKPLKPLRSYSTQNPTNNKILAKSLVKNKSLSHLLRYDEVGMPSSKGQRFTDRLLLGKSNLNAKIITVKIFLQRNTQLIAGISLIYSGNKKGGQHVKKQRQSRQSQYIQQEFNCRGSAFVRSISGTLTSDDKVQSLMFASSDGSTHKFGKAVTTSKSFNLDIGSSEYPTCVFGSYVVIKQGPRQKSYLQHLGFQIQNDSGQGPAINQFND